MSTNKLHVLELCNVPILEQLQIEEALLRADKRNWLILNEGSSDAIVMGISGKREELVCPDNYSLNPIPIIRRFSGGGTVIVDQDTLFVTTILNKKDVAIAPFPKHLLKWHANLYQPLLQNEGFALRENDYVLKEKKIGGNAQSITKLRMLQHTTFLWDYQKEKMDLLLLPPKTPQYRKHREHTDFLCRLKEVLPHPHNLFSQIKKSLKQLFALQTISRKETDIIKQLPHRKSTTII